jgi:hypothetical protein
VFHLFLRSRLTTVFVPQAGLLPARLSQAVLLQACLRAAHNAVRRALRAALDAAPCRRFAPRRLCIEGPKPAAAVNPRKGKIFRRETILDSTSEVMVNLLDFEDTVILVWHLLTTLIRTSPTGQQERVS